MQGLDTAFFQAESPTMPLHVIGALVLDPSTATGPWGFETVVELLGERIHLLPPFRWRAVPVPGDLDQPRWIEDPDFDLDRHMHRVSLPEPADLGALADFVGKLAGVALDRSRPLWEMYVVEGMADGLVALVTKLHHSFMDGGAGSEVMASLFDLDPDGGPVDAPDEPWRPEDEPSPVRLLAEGAGGALARAAKLPAVIARTTLGFAGSAASMLRSRTIPSLPVGPATPLNGSLTAERVVAFTRCSLAEVKRTKTALGVTVNDVMLAAAATALRAELLQRSALPDRPLVAMVPISERATDESEFTNRTAVLSVALPVQISDPVERLRAVRELTLAAKERHRARGDGVLEEWAALLPPLLIRAGARSYVSTGVARFVPPLFNVIVSNIPGPPIPLYLAGARVTRLYPMGPLFEGAGVNITLMSQGDAIDIGIMSCPSMLDDPDRLGRRFIDGLAELAEMADLHPVLGVDNDQK